MSTPLLPRAAAILGSGPAGMFTADALARLAPQCRIDIFERLELPYGLARYGVAPDHPGTRAITRQFDRLLKRPTVHFHGGITHGVDVHRLELERHYDLIFLATGAPVDRLLEVPGEDLAGVYRAGQIAGWYNNHPDLEKLDPRFGDHLVIVGMGNVAIDIARILALGPKALESTEISRHALASLVGDRPGRISLVARGSAASAKFSPAEMRGLLQVQNVAVNLKTPITCDASDDGERRRLEMLADSLPSPIDASLQIDLYFESIVERITGTDTVEAIELAAADLSPLCELKCDSVVTALGFDVVRPVDPAFANTSPATSDCARDAKAGCFAVGWARQGSTGNIGNARVDVRRIVESALREPFCGGDGAPEILLDRLRRYRPETEGRASVNSANAAFGAARSAVSI